MTTLKSVMSVTGLAVAMLLAAGCQRVEQTNTENPGGNPAAGSSAPTQGAAPLQSRQPTPSAASPAKAPASAAKPAAPAAAQARNITLPEGTAIKVRTTHALSTRTLKAGDTFDAVLDSPLLAGGQEIFPTGATVMGKVTESDPGGRVKGVASLSIELNMLHTADGQMLMISTSPVSVEAKSSKGKDAAKIAAGSAIGAAVGAIAGGGKGAGIGAASGAGAGTAVVLGTRGDAAEIPSETVLEFSLRTPVTFSR